MNDFEQVCLAHLPQIKHKLSIAGVLTRTASWRSNDRENAAQIDLLIDRNDKVINLCEMKDASEEFVIEYWGNIQSEITMDDLFGMG